MYIIFKFKEGNPYIAKTDKEATRILKKYKGRCWQISAGVYYIDNGGACVWRF